MTILPNLTLLAIAGLATARITSLVVHDTILEPARNRIFLWSPPPEEIGEEFYTFQTKRGAPLNNFTEIRDPGFFGRLLSCTHCMAVWVAVAVYLAVTYAPNVSLPALVIAALAQISEATIKASR